MNTREPALTRPRIDNSHFDAAVMLHKALAGAYPSAGHRSKERAAEIAYWRARVARQRANEEEPTP